MVYTKVFKSGNSQAVRIPKQFHLNTEIVDIVKQNDKLIIQEKPQSLAKAFEIMTEMPADFFENGRVDVPPQEREF